MTRLFLFCLLLTLLAAATGCSKSSQVASGVEAKATKIERSKSMTIGTTQLTASPGHDVTRVFFELSASSNVKDLKLPLAEQQLIDTDGNAYKSNADLSFHFGSGGGKMDFDSLFEVPTGATLKTIKLGQATLDLSGLEGAKPQP